MSVSVPIFYSEGEYMSCDECFGVCSIFGWVDCIVYVFGGEFVLWELKDNECR